MRSFLQNWRDYRVLTERICLHRICVLTLTTFNSEATTQKQSMLAMAGAR